MRIEPMQLEKLDNTLGKNGFERFEVVGEGVRSAVYRCHHIESAEDYAIKVWNAGADADIQKLNAMFENIKVRDKAATPPHSVHIKAVSPRKYYVLMRLMQCNLIEFHDEYEMTPDLAELLLYRLLNSAHHLHENLQSIHGNIKPSNILLDHKGQFRLSDCLYHPFRSGNLIKDPRLLPIPEMNNSDHASQLVYPQAKYLCPELINNQFGPIGIWMDQFMIGFTVMEQLLGQTAFEELFCGVGTESNDVELGWMRWYGSTDEIPSPYDILPDLDPGMKEVLHRLTRKKVEHRYRNASTALGSIGRDPASYHDMGQAEMVESKLEVMKEGLDDTGEVSQLSIIKANLESGSGETAIQKIEKGKKPSGQLSTKRIETRQGLQSHAPSDSWDIIPAERYSVEWWQEQWQDPGVRRKSLLAGAVLFLMILLSTIGSPGKTVTVKFTTTAPETVAEIDSVPINFGSEPKEVNGKNIFTSGEMKFPVGKKISINATARDHKEVKNQVVTIEESKQTREIEIKLDPVQIGVTVDYPRVPGSKLLINNNSNNSHAFDTIRAKMGETLNMTWTAPGYVSFLKTWNVESPANKPNIIFKLNFLPQTLNRKVVFQAEPANATIKDVAKGITIGTAGTPVDIKPGQYKLMIESSGYEPQEHLVEIPVGEGEYKTPPYKLKSAEVKSYFEITTRPTEATLTFEPVSPRTLTIPSDANNFEVPVGSTWNIIASFKGQSKSMTFKVSEGKNSHHFDLDIIDRWTNPFGMEFVFIAPPLEKFKLGGVERISARNKERIEKKQDKFGENRFQPVDRGSNAPVAIVLQPGQRKVEIKPTEYFPEVEVSVSMGKYIAARKVSIGDWKRVMSEYPRFMEKGQPDDYPVLGISRKEADSFIRKLEQREKVPTGIYNMLTDAEFEYLANASDANSSNSTLFNFNHGNVDLTNARKADNLGLHDLFGNTLELVQDYYRKDFYADNPNLVDPVNHDVSSLGIARGCSYKTKPEDFSKKARTLVNENNRNPLVGFRIVRKRTPEMDQEQFRQGIESDTEVANFKTLEAMKLSMDTKK